MGSFVEQLRLAEKAAEYIYFSKVNRKIINAPRKQMLTEKDTGQPSDQSSAPIQEEEQCQ